jgi:hypothetical protein
MTPPSFATDIRPLFRDKDVKVMQRMSDLDLSSYDTVKERAADILERLEDGSMPCDEPWTPEQIASFKSWMDDGLAP